MLGQGPAAPLPCLIHCLAALSAVASEIQDLLFDYRNALKFCPLEGDAKVSAEERGGTTDLSGKWFCFRLIFFL